MQSRGWRSGIGGTVVRVNLSNCRGRRSPPHPPHQMDFEGATAFLWYILVYPLVYFCLVSGIFWSDIHILTGSIPGIASSPPSPPQLDSGNVGPFSWFIL